MQQIEQALRDYANSWGYSETWEACRYSLLNPGKRIRPILAIEAFKVVGGSGDAIIPYACALEMFHTSSLIVDDIMDGDEYRRGLPACHKKFSLGSAVLASHILSVEGMNLMSDNADCLDEVVKATQRMCRGQDAEKAEDKTGALLKVCLTVGAIIGGATKEQRKALEIYGEHVGLLFQLRDDILDGERPEQELVLDLSCLDIFGEKADTLRKIAQFIVTRNT